MSTPDRPAPLPGHAPHRATVTPFIIVENAQSVVDFAVAVFDAVVHEPLHRSDGTLWNAELRIGRSSLMVADPQPGMRQTAFLYVHVADCDAAYRRAIEAGAEPVMEPADQFYGDRNAGVRDAAGNLWWIATFQEAVPHDEIVRRARELERQRGG